MDSLSSDHLPITVSSVFSAEKGNPVTSTKFNYDLANWDLFRSTLGAAERDVGLPDLEEVNGQIVSSVLEAAREAIPMTGGGSSRPQSNPWWNKDFEEAVRVKRKMHIIIIIINPLTARVVGAPDDFATSFLHFSPFSTALWDLPNSRPDVVFPPLSLSALSSSPFHCALQDGFGQT